MTNKDVQLAGIKASTEKFGYLCDLTKHLITILGAVFAVKLFFDGLEPFMSSNPETIRSMALLIEEINVSNITGYFLACGTGTGWYIERKGKKRAIQEKGEYQKIVEKNDSYRSSSGLTSTGETPGGAS